MTLQSEAKWAAQIAELEKERGSLAHAVARREEELAALQEQLEHTRRELTSAKVSDGCPLQMTSSGLTAMGLNDVFMEMGWGRDSP